MKQKKYIESGCKTVGELHDAFDAVYSKKFSECAKILYEHGFRKFMRMEDGNLQCSRRMITVYLYAAGTDSGEVKICQISVDVSHEIDTSLTFFVPIKKITSLMKHVVTFLDAVYKK